MDAPGQIVATGGFDDIRALQLRFLEEAAKLGELTVLLWPDQALQQQTGRAPKFPLAERLYFLNALRYVARVVPVAEPVHYDGLPELEGFAPRFGLTRNPAPIPGGALIAGSTASSTAFCPRHG